MSDAVRQTPETEQRSRSEPISLRVPDYKLNLMDEAAAALGKTRTSFLIESALERAEVVVLKQRLFTIDEEALAELQTLLDLPPEPVPELRALMERKAPWE